MQNCLFAKERYWERWRKNCFNTFYEILWRSCTVARYILVQTQEVVSVFFKPDGTFLFISHGITNSVERFQAFARGGYKWRWRILCLSKLWLFDRGRALFILLLRLNHSWKLQVKCPRGQRNPNSTPEKHCALKEYQRWQSVKNVITITEPKM